MARRAEGEGMSVISDEDECLSCPEEMPRNECPKSKRRCGHHCNCSWIHDRCHWCGVEFGEDGGETWPTEPVTTEA